MIKDILVHVDESPRCDVRLDVAITLARRFGAHLAGLYGSDPRAWTPYVGFEGTAQVLSMLEQAEAARRAAAEAKFTERTAGAQLRTEWRLFGGWATDLAEHARYADLVVIGQTDRDEPDVGRLPVADVILGAGRPVLVIPAFGRFDTIGARPLIGWDGSREAARAVADALPFLRRAEIVRIMTVEAAKPPEAATAAEPGRRADALAAHLTRHGVAVEVVREAVADLGVGDVLLSRAADLAIDLIVMGAYAHSRMRELVFGGATLTVLRQMTVPVLMSH